MNIGILSLGCPRNVVDSEEILGRLRFKGHNIVDITKADVAIVNTCAFIDEAKKESIDAILELIELKKQGQLKKIIVYGCLSQRYGKRLIKELPKVDAFVGAIALNHSSKRYGILPKHFAYLKICEGCLNNCSYCAIPKIKPKFTSLNEKDVLKKVELLDKSGVSELNIIGQDITGYGTDIYGAPMLAKLLQKILKKSKNINWFRLLYLYPSRVSNELLAVIKDEERICKYIDLPLQHINNRILKLMNRKTQKKQILDLIEKIRKAIPSVALRTSLIVGFPSETEKEFKELLNFINEVKFERMGAFIYSREEGTLAYSLTKQIPPQIKSRRFNEIMSLQQKISREVNKKFLDKNIDVLIEEKEAGYYLGRSQHDAPEVDGLVYVYPVRKDNSNKSGFSNGVNSLATLKPGSLVKVKVTDTLEYDLVGETLN